MGMTVMARREENVKAGNINPAIFPTSNNNMAPDICGVVLMFTKLMCALLPSPQSRRNFKMSLLSTTCSVSAVAAAVSGKTRRKKTKSKIIPSLFLNF